MILILIMTVAQGGLGSGSSALAGGFDPEDAYPCIYIYIYTHIHVCMCIYVCICVCVYIYISISISIYIYLSLSLSIYIYICIRTLYLSVAAAAAATTSSSTTTTCHILSTISCIPLLYYISTTKHILSTLLHLPSTYNLLPPPPPPPPPPLPPPWLVYADASSTLRWVLIPYSLHSYAYGYLLCHYVNIPHHLHTLTPTTHQLMLILIPVMRRQKHIPAHMRVHANICVPCTHTPFTRTDIPNA